MSSDAEIGEEIDPKNKELHSSTSSAKIPFHNVVAWCGKQSHFITLPVSIYQTYYPTVCVLFKVTVDWIMRGYMSHDGKVMLGVHDFISVANKINDDNEYAKKVWNIFKKISYTTEIVRPDEGDITVAMSIVGLKRLLAELPMSHRISRAKAKSFRNLIDATFERYSQGDTSMIEEIRPNHQACAVSTSIDETVSSAANAASSVKINAKAEIETEIEDTSAISKFFSDPDNRAFTSADGNAWWHVPAFNRAASFDGNDHPTLSETWSRLLHGPFAGQIKDPQISDVQYVKKDRIALELFDKGGPGFTPVMTILGLQKLWNVRRMHTKELLSAAASAAASRMQVRLLV